MKVSKQYVGAFSGDNYEAMLERVCEAAGLCYGNHGKQRTKEEMEKFVSSIINKGHESVIEHVSLAVEIHTDRATAQQLTRHRLASYTMSSTRYCNYTKSKFGGEIDVIIPEICTAESQYYYIWHTACENAEKAYRELIEAGVHAEHARNVLPLSLACDFMMTANIREWRHILKLRTTKETHRQTRDLMLTVLRLFKQYYPIFFSDIVEEK